MNEDSGFDVFLSHNSKDKAVVRPLAKRLQADGLKVWFDEWVLKPGDSILAKIDEGLEHSRVLVLCMSAQAFGSDWAQLEAGTFRFRDPLNRERRLIPLRLDDAPIKGSLAQFLYINWGPADREQEYAKLLEACGHPANWPHCYDVPGQALNAHLKGLVEMFSSSAASGAYMRRKALIVPDNLEIDDVEDWLANRCSDHLGARITVVLGEYGYGKTTLCLRVASKQAEQLLAGTASIVPVYLYPTKEILEQTSVSYAERLAPFVRPAVGAVTLTRILQSGHASVFIDGLDEILGSLSQAERIHLVKSLISTPLAQGNCVVLTCRTHVFETLGEAQSLVAGLDTPQRQMIDRTADVVEQLLRGLKKKRDAQDDLAKVILLKCLSDEDLESYMRRTDCATEWDRTKSVPGVIELARRPVLLYLIGKLAASLRENTAEEMLRDETLSVSALYELAIRTWMRRDSACCNLSEADVFELLEAKAMEFWHDAFRRPTLLGNQSPFTRRVHQWRNTVTRLKHLVPMLERAGLLSNHNSSHGVPFLHYSFLEFFLARAVAAQVCSFDASILAMLNLVAMYTVNQFLVEQILSTHLVENQRSQSKNLPKKKLGRTYVMTRPVNGREFRAFLESSGWRDGGALWGYSPSRAGGSGVRPLEGMEIEDFEWGTPDNMGDEAVTNISWYDACLFAKYFGGRLCSPDEVNAAKSNSRAVTWEWTCKWHDYGRSLMAVQSRDGGVGGANPDVRDSCLGFRIAWREDLQAD